jgi:hypothetical protein
MKKIPTIFDRDWDGDRSRVLNVQNGACDWVFAGEGKATKKLDGTSCLIRGGKLYKRRELRKGDKAPSLFELVDVDLETGKIVGWVPVGDGPEDRYHREAFAEITGQGPGYYPDGTYELIGPKIQGNPEGRDSHILFPHGVIVLDGAPRTFNGLREWLVGADMEGLVFHHPDGRMGKIKLRDFGLKRAVSRS